MKGVWISKINFKRFNLEKSIHEDDDAAQSKEKAVYKNDINILSENIMDWHNEINSVGKQENPALCLAIEIKHIN